MSGFPRTHSKLPQSWGSTGASGPLCGAVVFLPPHCLGLERQGPSLLISSQGSMQSAVSLFIQQVLVGFPWPSSG